MVLIYRNWFTAEQDTIKDLNYDLEHPDENGYIPALIEMSKKI